MGEYPLLPGNCMCSAVHTKTHETCLNSYTRAPTSGFCQYFFMKYVAVTPQYKKENEELKHTGSDNTLELPADPHTASLTVITVLCRINVVCFSSKLSVVLVSFGTFYRFTYL
jgi:hypothetical protein